MATTWPAKADPVCMQKQRIHLCYHCERSIREPGVDRLLDKVPHDCSGSAQITCSAFDLNATPPPKKIQVWTRCRITALVLHRLPERV